MIRAERLGHLILLQLTHSTFEPEGMPKKHSWTETFYFRSYLVIVAIPTILGLISESLMASRLR